jgi:hypothetical protein
MKVAYLFFVYKNPRLIAKTIETLRSPESGFFLHVDGKSDFGDFASIRGENVFFSEKRLPVYWAEFSGVRAVLLLMSQALAAPQRYDYLVLLSGSEYPLRSREYIHRFLDANRGTEYMTMVRMPNEAAGKPISRINTLRLPSHRPVARTLVRILAKLGLAQRDHAKYLGDLKPYAGNTWWALSREACKYALEFEERHPRVVKFFEDCFAPEETYLQTILGNSPFASRMRRNLLYEDWSGRKDHPALISERHLALFESRNEVSVRDIHGPGELLFARKFSDETLGLLPRLDAMIRKKDEAVVNAR